MKIFMLITLFFILGACGKKPTAYKEVKDTFFTEPEGSFSAILLPLKAQSTPTFKGLVTVTKYGDNFHVKVKYQNGPEGSHRQGLYAISSCALGDQFDLPAVISFDEDLSAVDSASEIFPFGTSYDYEQSTSYSLMLANSKLHHSELQLEGKSVVIHSDNEPFACGVLSKFDFSRVDMEPNPEPEVIEAPGPPSTPEVWPVPEQPEVRTRPFWQRWSHRLGRWWRRMWGY